MSADFETPSNAVNFPAWLMRLVKVANVVHNPVTGWAVLAVSLLITVMAYFIASHQLTLRAQQHFEFRASEVVHAIDERMAMYEQALLGGVGLFDSSEQVTRAEWAAYVRALHLRSRLPGIQAMAFAVPLTPEQLPAHIHQVRQEGFANYQVNPSGERDEYSAIYFIEPFDWRNQRAFGYDMWSNAVRREAMMRARDSGATSMSGVITLVQETNEDVQQGFLTYLPVYSGDMPPLSSVEHESAWRRANFVGWVYAAFRGQDLINGVIGSDDHRIHFAVHDTTYATEGPLTNASQIYRSGSFNGSASDVMHLTLPIELYGRNWTVKFEGNPYLFLTKSESNQPNYILIAGIIIDLLLFYVIMSLHLVNRHADIKAQALKAEQDKSIQSLAEQARLVEAIEKESQTFFEIAPDALLVVAQSGEIVKANQRAHDVFGYHESTMNGLNIDVLVPDRIRGAHSELRQRYSAAPTARIMGANRSLAAVKRNGENFEVTINLVPLEIRGQLHTVAAVHDVTEQNVARKALAAAKEKAEIANSSKSEFLANMSHEIRTPLNAVIGSAQLLENTRPTPAQQKYVSMIRGSGETLLGIINDILDFSKVEAGCMELSPAPFDLDEVVERLAMMMSVNMGEKPIQLYIDIAPNVSRKLIGDSLRLQQVLINLASNAIKFTASGEVKVTISGCYNADTNQQTLNVVVSDTGIGMSPEQQGLLFKAFSQADGSITRRYGGTGLGLVISSRIIELMGGRIHLCSEIDEGTSFGFATSLPVIENNEPCPMAKLMPKSVVLMTDFKPATHVVSNSLLRWGWAVQIFSPSRIDPAIGTGKTFDFCLLDVDSIGSSLEVFVEQLVESGFVCNAFILLLSNHQRSLLLDDKIRNLTSSYVMKPLVDRSLLAAFDESLSRQGEPRLDSDANECGGPKKLLSGIHVLLVEDNVLNQTIALDVLADIGVTCDLANNGREAIEIFTAHQGQFDLILMDIQMPVMDGKTAAGILKKEKACKVPIIAMTAGVLQSEQEGYLLAGMDGFVPKPIDHGELYRAIKRFAYAKGADEKVALVTNSEPSSRVIAPAAKQVLNYDRLANITKGRAERTQKLAQSLQVIVAAGDQPLQDTQQALIDGKVEEAKFALHSLKGVVGNFGAERLPMELERVEVTLEQGLTEQAAEQIEQLRGHLQEFLAAAQAWIDQCPDKASGA